MQVGQFPAAAANSLIQGYCDDFVSLAAILAQTLEQVSMRGLNIDASRPALQRIENGMRNLAEGIVDLLERGKVAGDLSATLAEKPSTPATAAAPAPANGRNAPTAATATPARPSTERIGATTGPRANPAPRPGVASNTAAPVAAPTAPPRTGARTSTPASASPSAQAQTPAQTPRAPAPRSANEGLKGTSQSMPLLSVFQFLGRMRKAGTMRVGLGNENLTFELQNGCILATTSTQCPREELLGEMLIAAGACTAEDLDPIVVRVGTGNNERFGQAAVEAGIVTERQVVDALGRQAAHRYARACKHHDARYEFVEGLRSQTQNRFVAAPVAVA